MALRMLAVFWTVMSIAGLITEGIFRASGIVPTTRPTTIAAEHFAWNSTGILNLVFLAAFAAIWLLSRNRERLGGGSGYAIDPVCGMQVETAHAPATVHHEGHTVYFCSDHCRERFEASPSRFLGVVQVPLGRDEEGMPLELDTKPTTHTHQPNEEDSVPTAIDPVCKMTVDPTTAAAIRTYNGVNYFFCNPGCAETFDADPGRYANAAEASRA
jgi:hypothetical protein